MARGGGSLNRWSPLPVVVGVVAAVLIIQVIAAVAVSVAARSDAEAASRDIAALVGDSYAERAAVVLRPAMGTATALARQTSGGSFDVDDSEAAAREIFALMGAHPAITSIGVRSGDGSWLMVRRVREGYTVQGATAGGDTYVQGFDTEFRPSDAVPPPRAGSSINEASWVDDAAASTEPLWVDPGNGVANEEAVVAVAARSPSGSAVAAVGIGVRAIGDQVAAGASGDLAHAYLLTSRRNVLASDRGGPIPEGLASASDLGLADTSGFERSGLGVVGAVGDRVVYERPLGLERGPEWVIYATVEPEGIVPGLANMSRNLLVYTASLVVLAVLVAVVLWALSGRLAEMSKRARTDRLTGVANRHEFDTRGSAALAAAERRDREVVVIAIDLDNFKRVNDEVSHEAGDRVLRACAEALKHHSGSRDLVARIGGDEFAVLHWLEAGQTPADVVETMRASAQQAMVDTDTDAALTGLSAGFALASDHTFDLDAAWAAADHALVGGRRSGKGATYGT